MSDYDALLKFWPELGADAGALRDAEALLRWARWLKTNPRKTTPWIAPLAMEVAGRVLYAQAARISRLERELRRHRPWLRRGRRLPR